MTLQIIKWLAEHASSAVIVLGFAAVWNAWGDA